MISVDEINNLQKTIDAKNGTIAVLKKTVCQWVKEYNILDGIIDLKDVEIQKLNDIIDSYQPRLQKYKDLLQKIKAIAKEGLQPICYKANCATCRCYSKKISNDTLENIINDYFDEDGDFTDTEGDFFEVLQAFIDRERVACNKAQPISEKILDLITKAGEE